VTVTVLAAIAAEHEAHACGGCFAPRETPTVVSDHRMIFSVSKTQSTLYDQIKYTGSPSSFAWVLPISGTVTVGLSADILFTSLDQTTQTQIFPPPQNCPPPPSYCGSSSSSGFGGAAAPAADNADAGSVTVLKHDVVGPYDTVQLAATTPQALENWLSTNGYALPTDVQAVVDAYQQANFNFLAMRLAPGQGIQDMRPVRVTSQGATIALPLRMVAAGTGPTVGITLWVVSEGRYEPSGSYGSFFVTTDEIAWDWTKSQSTYTTVRAQKTAAGNGRLWEIESSIPVVPDSILSVVQRGSFNGTGPVPVTEEDRAAIDYLPVKDSQGTVTQTALQVRDADLTTLTFGISASNTRVTRLRADLAHSALDSDLVLQASSDQSQLSNVRQLTKEVAPPLCPVYDGCNQVGTAPRPPGYTGNAAPTTSGGSSGGSTFTCASGPSGANRGLTAIALGVIAAGLAYAVRRRRRH
jgi:hypothetical protein